MFALHNYFSERYQAAERYGALVDTQVAMLAGHSTLVEDRRVCNYDTWMSIEPGMIGHTATLWARLSQNPEDQVSLNLGKEGVFVSSGFVIRSCVEKVGPTVHISDACGALAVLDSDEAIESVVVSLRAYGFVPKLPNKRRR